MKVFFATPSGEMSRYSEFWRSVQGIVLPEGVTIHPDSDVCRSPYIANNQNWLARLFLAGDADYYWLLNDDQMYPATTLARLLAYHKDVIVPLCLRHDLPCEPLIYDRVDPEAPDQYLYHYLQKDDPELLAIVGAGGGGMLIHRRVFEAIPDPWWETHTAPFTLFPAKTPEGDWVTMFTRTHQQFAIPAAVAPTAAVAPSLELVAQS